LTSEAYFNLENFLSRAKMNNQEVYKQQASQKNTLRKELQSKRLKQQGKTYSNFSGN